MHLCDIEYDMIGWMQSKTVMLRYWSDNKVRTYVRMYVCMYVRMHACMYVCMYVWMDGWMDGWMDV